eukprot:12980363-Heterocapsa_arctica.AAC.1
MDVRKFYTCKYCTALHASRLRPVGRSLATTSQAYHDHKLVEAASWQVLRENVRHVRIRGN